MDPVSVNPVLDLPCLTSVATLSQPQAERVAVVVCVVDPASVTGPAFEQIGRMLAGAFPHKPSVIMLPKGDVMDFLSEAEMNKMGWFRKSQLESEDE